MNATHSTLVVAAFFASAIVAAAEPAAPAVPATTPAPATTAEAPYVGEPMELTVEQRQEKAFRTIQSGLDKQRSDRIEDEDVIVCKKEKPTGSNVAVINCATNRFWKAIRASSMSAGIAGGGRTAGGSGAYGGGGGGSAKKDDKVITLSLSDYYKLEKRFGKVPKTDAGKP